MTLQKRVGQGIGCKIAVGMGAVVFVLVGRYVGMHLTIALWENLNPAVASEMSWGQLVHNPDVAKLEKQLNERLSPGQVFHREREVLGTMRLRRLQGSPIESEEWADAACKELAWRPCSLATLTIAEEQVFGGTR